jgi:hypothetical protein
MNNQLMTKTLLEQFFEQSKYPHIRDFKFFLNIDIRSPISLAIKTLPVIKTTQLPFYNLSFSSTFPMSQKPAEIIRVIRLGRTKLSSLINRRKEPRHMQLDKS